jgi:hypothetical protein
VTVKRYTSIAVVLLAALSAAAVLTVNAFQAPAPTVAVDADDLGGVVTSRNGAEVGVWVIAETTDLPTRFVRIVVTDDQGRYLLPDLPSASYQIWVRGYGLVDSPKVEATPGRSLNLTAVVAPDPRAAAQYYPAGYWWSMLRVPGEDEFPGTGPEGNGISPRMTSQAEYVNSLKTSCSNCHVTGSRSTRELWTRHEGESSVAAWERRIQAGQGGPNMLAQLAGVGAERGFRELADWSDRIAAGALPPAPSRPQGLERNIVLTLWDWSDEKAYLHDLISTDRRNPTVNANGLIYGATELSVDWMPVLDPVRHVASRIDLAPRDPSTAPAQSPAMPQPSPHWGDEVLWTSRVNVHNQMLDASGRVWMASTVRPPEDNPDFCREGSDHPSARAYPTQRAGRHLTLYDPRTQQLTHIDTCFGTHHVMFAEDADNTLWSSGGGEVVGWLNTRMFDETGDEAASQGWTPLVLDTNGNGVRDAYVGPDDPIDPALDKRVLSPLYAISPAADGSIWGSSLNHPFPGALVRLTPGANPSETALAELFEPPWDRPGFANIGYGPRGMDVDRDGVAWAAMASGHMASFDRRKCEGPLNGPEAMGQHCPEGWAFYAEPLPQMSGVDAPGSAGRSYYTWVDQFNTFGLGNNVPINTGNQSEGLLALKDGQWVVLRVPYPMGYSAKWLEGRIDDPNAGWKGRGLWATYGGRAPWLMETGKGTMGKVLRFQLRPDPLAK